MAKTEVSMLITHLIFAQTPDDKKDGEDDDDGVVDKNSIGTLFCLLLFYIVLFYFVYFYFVLFNNLSASKCIGLLKYANCLR